MVCEIFNFNFRSMLQQSCRGSVDRALGGGAEEPRFDSQSGIIFFTRISFKEEMRQMEKNKNKNNASNS